MIQGIQNPNAIKNAVINHALTENQHELASKLTEEAILEQAKTVPINQLSEQIKTNLSISFVFVKKVLGIFVNDSGNTNLLNS